MNDPTPNEWKERREFADGRGDMARNALRDAMRARRKKAPWY